MQKKLIVIMSVFLVALIVVSFAAAQVTYSDPVFTSYQIVNLSDSSSANVIVTYYDKDGNASPYQPTFPNIPPGGSQVVQQSLENQLASGRWSAVISADQPIAAIANQQLGASGSGTSIAPFSSYSGASDGSMKVVLPSIMHNWFGYNTEIYVQNVGGGPANATIDYVPTTLGLCTTGATGQQDSVTGLAKFASDLVEQKNKTSLGAPSVSGCGAFTARFLGSATITSNEPVVVVVNQAVQDKLFTYNGFKDVEADTLLLAPAYMRDFFGYYASLTIANPGNTLANVDVVYTSEDQYSIPVSTVVTGTHQVQPGESITLYDGPGSTSDLSSTFTRFFGTAVIKSDQPLVAMVNQESISSAGNQAGTYNTFSSSQGSTKISVPLIQSAFYGCYTSLTIMTVDGGEATVDITYTSDNQFSSVLNTSASYQHTTVNGFLNRYEGPTASASQSDLLDDPTWQSGGQRRFIGSAIIDVTNGSNIVAYVNSECSTSPFATSRDSLYTYNAFNLAGP